MTQETNQNFGNTSAPTNNSSQESYSSQESAIRTEKMVPQHRVDEIVREAYSRAHEKGKNEGMSMYQNSAQSQNQAPIASNQSQTISPEEIKRIAAEEIRRQNDEFFKNKDEELKHEKGTQILNQLFSKFQSAKEKYPDFDEKVSPYFNPVNAPVFGMINDFDNSADLAYEFSNRPNVLAEVKAALELGGHAVAHQKLKLLSESIKLNDKASSAKVPNQPLSQVQSSPVSSTNNGSPSSVRDFRILFSK